MTHKAIVISPFWASIASVVIAAGIGGGFLYAWDAHAQQEVMQGKVDSIEQAHLPERMARIEETVKSTDKTVDMIREEQREQSRKIDLLVESRSRPR